MVLVVVVILMVVENGTVVEVVAVVEVVMGDKVRATVGVKEKGVEETSKDKESVNFYFSVCVFVPVYLAAVWWLTVSA